MTRRAQARKLVGRRLRPLRAFCVGRMELAAVDYFEAAMICTRARAMLLGLGITLAGCATSPTVATLPSICPATPTTPAEARAEFPEFLPVLNESEMQAGDTRRAAGELLRVRVDSAAQYQSLRVNRDALRDWILSHSKE